MRSRLLRGKGYASSFESILLFAGPRALESQVILWPVTSPVVQKSHLQSLYKKPSDSFEEKWWESGSGKHLSIILLLLLVS